MSADDWTWKPTNPTDLAEFTVPGEFAMMRGEGEPPPTRAAAAAFVYGRLLELELVYDGPLYTWNSNVQQVRQPYQVVQGEKRGNCLDLSAAFAGYALAMRLRPLITVIEFPEGARHALVVIPDVWDDVSGKLHDEAVLPIWGRGVPFDRGVGTPSREQVTARLRGPWSEGGTPRWWAVELVALTDRRSGPLDFGAACEKGAEALERAMRIQMVDVLYVHKVLTRPPRAVDRSLVDRAARGPVAFGDAVRLRYADRLAVRPATWDLGGLEEIASEGATQDHALMVPALRRALRAKDVFHSIGGGKLGIRHLHWYFYEVTDRVVDTRSLEVLLVEAALTGHDRVPDALTGFLLRVALRNGLGLDHPALRDWVMENDQEAAAPEFIRKCRRPYWALILLGHEPLDGDRGWPIRLQAVVEPNPVGLVDAAGDDGEPIGQALVHAECHSPEELPDKLRRLIGDLQEKLDDAPMVVDLVAPLRFLTAGYEHQDLVPLPTGFSEPLSRRCEPRLRWVRHVLDRRVQRMQASRSAAMADDAWRNPPLMITPDRAATWDAVSAWLADEANARRPVVLAVEDGAVTTEVLGWLLAAGCGYIVWHGTDGGKDRTRRQWDQLDWHQRRMRLPEKLLNGGNVPDPPSIIWHDDEGRPGFDLPLARLQEPGKGDRR